MPCPGLRLCRWLAEEGAQVVVCQHSHTSASTRVRRALLVYGQGNFLFDLPSGSPEWRTGMLVKLAIHENGGFDHGLVPYATNPEGAGIEPLGPTATQTFLQGLEADSLAVLGDDAVCEARWREYCESRRYEYLSLVHGFPEPLRLLNRRPADACSTAGPPSASSATCGCESHREVLPPWLPSTSSASATPDVGAAGGGATARPRLAPYPLE
jgi:poly-gamma-glutamate synthesis protein (capsule biosynthesis protein)